MSDRIFTPAPTARSPRQARMKRRRRGRIRKPSSFWQGHLSSSLDDRSTRTSAFGSEHWETTRWSGHVDKLFIASNFPLAQAIAAHLFSSNFDISDGATRRVSTSPIRSACVSIEINWSNRSENRRGFRRAAPGLWKAFPKRSRKKLFVV